jgi:DMSO/TMAO reductase YedYZ molybdopterin-dependent catalytic subunit
MARTRLWIGLLVVLMALTACDESAPDVSWKLSVDGDVNAPITYTYQDLVKLRRAELKDIVTETPGQPETVTSWEGVTVFLLLQEPGGVEYTFDWWMRVTLADGSSRRYNMAELRGALVALKDGAGNWLAQTDTAPIRLIAPSLPTDAWLKGPVRFTLEGP